MRAVWLTAGAAVLLLGGVIVEQATAHHEQTRPTKISTIRAVYPDLYRRELRRPTLTPPERVSWQHLRQMARTRWDRQHPAATREHLVDYLDRHPSQVNNRRLAQLVLSPADFEGMDRIAAGGDGIGGRPGESDWRENVWNGGKLGYDGGNPGPRAQTCGARGAYAYGIGQACPAQKMEAWARAAGVPDPTRVYVSARLQLRWAQAYAAARPCRTLARCGAEWSITRSW